MAGFFRFVFDLGKKVVTATAEELAAIAKEDAQEEAEEAQFAAQIEAQQEALTEADQLALAGFSDAEKDALSDISKFNATIPSDSLNEVLAEQVRSGQDNQRQANVVARRNNILRGVTPKDESVASLRIIGNLQALSRLVPRNIQQTGGLLIYGTDQFILQGASEPDNEKVQIVETFGDPVAYFYGRRPRMYSYRGILYNTADVLPSGVGEGKEPVNGSSGLWRDNFKLAYDLFLRGTRSVRFRARAYLTYDRVLREGYIVRSSIEKDINPNHVQCMFSMFVTRELNLDSTLALRNNTDDGLKMVPDTSDAAILAKAKRTAGNVEVTSSAAEEVL